MFINFLSVHYVLTDKNFSLYTLRCQSNVVHTVHYVHNYLSSSNQRLMRHFSYTELHCLTKTPTRFSACGPILKESLLNF
jgi:hypothetical protein